MRFCKVADVLDWVSAYHRALAEEYQRLAEGATKERVALLLRYLSEHQKILAESTENYEEDTAAGLLTTWSDQCPTMQLPDSVTELNQTLSGKDTEEVIRRVIEFDDLLIDMYKALADKATNASVKSMFENLADMEQREEMRTVRDAQRLEDY